jgi:hypothetical protein
MQSKDMSGGLDRAIIRMVLTDPDIPSQKVMSGLKKEKVPETDRHHAQELRRITRLILEELKRLGPGAKPTPPDSCPDGP